ncbi:hypothetical protein ACTJJ7_14745 [Phyllobacterium sp. 22229]|uniref:hypothetical protein n=1 Tax=Phyllobacterium sp. 22229 TaxID=3453895 RepID=UPI003F82FA98
MVIFLLQALLLISAAFIIGAILGHLFKRFSPKTDSVSQESTRAADVRLAAATHPPVTPANDDVGKQVSGPAMVPPAEPVPAMASPASARSRTKAPARKTAASDTVRAALQQDETHRPALLKNARRGKPDRLSDIEGIGNVIQTELYALGVFHFDQIAGWDVDQAAWVSRAIGFPGRAHRENWMKQAAGLVKQTGEAPAKAKAAVKAKPKAAPRKPAKGG